jgi:hypothetical protein
MLGKADPADGALTEAYLKNICKSGDRTHFHDADRVAWLVLVHANRAVEFAGYFVMAKVAVAKVANSSLRFYHYGNDNRAPSNELEPLRTRAVRQFALLTTTGYPFERGYHLNYLLATAEYHHGMALKVSASGWTGIVGRN